MIDDYAQIIRFAKRLTRKYRMPDHAEDLAQEIYISIYTKRGATYYHVAVDYLRTHLGKNAVKRTCSLSEADAVTYVKEPDIIFDILKKKISVQDHSLLHHIYVKNMSNIACAKKFGVTESCISQRLSRLHERLSLIVL